MSSEESIISESLQQLKVTVSDTDFKIDEFSVYIYANESVETIKKKIHGVTGIQPAKVCLYTAKGIILIIRLSIKCYRSNASQ